MTPGRWLERLARWCPVDAEASEELRRSLRFLRWEVDGDAFVSAGYAIGGLVCCLGAPLVVLAPGVLTLPAGLGVVAGALLAVHAVHATPRVLATARRTSALGDAPDLIARAVLRMRLAPSPERAAAFAAEAEAGGLSASLRSHVRRAAGTPRSGLGRFGDEWDDWFPALRRSVTLVEAAGDAPPADRGRLLDRSLAVVLEGTETKMRDFAGDIRGPATGLYAFGVLLPTALVALVPAAHAAGVAVTPPAVALVYDLLLPLVLVVASGYLLARRPVAFRPPDVDRDHPDVPDRRHRALLVGLGIGLAGGLATGVLGPLWAVPVAALGFGLGSGLVVAYCPVTAVYEDVQRIEAGLGDALALVGRRVTNGQSVETAVAETAETLDGAMGEVLGEGARRQRQLKVGLDEAFRGEHGAVADVPSPRVESSLALLAVAGRDGAPAGSAVVALGEHVEELRSVQATAQHNLERVCSTLGSTASIFGPLVAGATVALARTMAGDGSLGGADPTWWLGPMVGGYVLAMAAILTALATGLHRGLDGPLVGYRIGRALCTATASFLVAFYLAGLVA